MLSVVAEGGDAGKNPPRNIRGDTGDQLGKQRRLGPWRKGQCMHFCRE